MNYISHDRTMQDIVYKLVPNLQQKELKREQEFYRKHGQQGVKLECDEVNDNHTENNVAVKEEENKDYHRNDEQLNVCLECQGAMKNLKRKFLRISSQATVSHLKKFVALKLYYDQTKYTNIEILCNDEILGKHHTLKFVAVTRWRVKDGPLLLHYRQKTLDFWPRVWRQKLLTYISVSINRQTLMFVSKRHSSKTWATVLHNRKYQQGQYLAYLG